jgi:8-oxo-dGTP diphosphatase
VPPDPNAPRVAVDCVVTDADGRVLLIKRKNPPFRNRYALPGGFVEAGESVEDACRRELLEETGVRAGRLTLVGVYSEPGRDPRGPVISIAFRAHVRRPAARAGDDAAQVEWLRNWREASLAFDHADILAQAMRKSRIAKRR